MRQIPPRPYWGARRLPLERVGKPRRSAVAGAFVEAPGKFSPELTDWLLDRVTEKAVG